MKRFGIVSYNIYCNFTNYGSALQSWALQQAINKLGENRFKAVLVDYCPDVLRDKDPRDPIRNMWDKDETSRCMCEMSMPAILENADKFDDIFDRRFEKTSKSYTSENFEEITENENPDGFVCGSDTIFCIDEFGGFEDGYWANYSCMKEGYSVAYAASFGDACFDEKSYPVLNERLKNFKAIGLREYRMVPYVRANTDVPVQRVLDPTLLLAREDYDILAAPKQEDKPYLLLYARRYDPFMEEYAEKLAKENGWEIIEISLRAANKERHRMFYEAGVEEFLSLVKYARFVVTNSYHGMIFSIQYRRQFCVFTREQCDSKIEELTELLGLSDRLMSRADINIREKIKYDKVAEILNAERKRSLAFLQKALEGAINQ